ncbi:MAG: DUF4114 domain-containing protein [Cyanobacteria bacterium P01_A01_bin.84]
MHLSKGAGSEYLTNSIGEGFEQYGFDVPGVEGLIDQVHIAQAQFAGFAFDTPVKEAENGDNYLDWSNFEGGVEVGYTISREAKFDNEVYFYTVDNVTGTVDGNTVGSEGYVQAALSNIVSPIFSAEDGNIETGSFTMEAGDVIGTMIIADGTLSDAQSGNATVYFSFGTATDGFDHIRKSGDNVFEFEDLPGGGDLDFNDIVITLDKFSL